MDTPAIMDTSLQLLPLLQLLPKDVSSLGSHLVEIQHEQKQAALAERARLYDIYRNLGIIPLVKSLQETK